MPKPFWIFVTGFVMFKELVPVELYNAAYSIFALYKCIMNHIYNYCYINVQVQHYIFQGKRNTTKNCQVGSMLIGGNNFIRICTGWKQWNPHFLSTTDASREGSRRFLSECKNSRPTIVQEIKTACHVFNQSVCVVKFPLCCENSIGWCMKLQDFLSSRHGC